MEVSAYREDDREHEKVTSKVIQPKVIQHDG